MKKVLFTLLILVFSADVFAGHTKAKIDKILLYESGNLVYVYPEGGVSNPAACHGSNGDYLSFKMNRPMAKEYLSLLMLAFASNKVVEFWTKNDCIDQSNSETINYFVVHG